MKERSGLIALAMKYNKIVLLLIGILVICGVFALYKIPKQEFPIFTIRQGVVVAAYPGATSGVASASTSGRHPRCRDPLQRRVASCRLAT